MHGSLWLIVNAVRRNQLTLEEAGQIIDELAATNMALPVDGAGLLAYAYQHGLLA